MYSTNGVLLGNWFEERLQEEQTKRQLLEENRPKLDGISETQARFQWPEPEYSDDPYADTSKGCLAVPPPIRYVDRAPPPDRDAPAGLGQASSQAVAPPLDVLHWDSTPNSMKQSVSSYQCQYLAPGPSRRRRS